MATIDREDDKLSRKEYIEKYGIEKRDAQQMVNRASKMCSNRDKGKSGDYITSKDTKRKYIQLLTPIAREARAMGKTLESLSPKQASDLLDRLAPNMNKRDVASTRTALQKSFRLMPKFVAAEKANGKPVTLRMCNLGKADPPLKSRSYSIPSIRLVLETLSPRHRLAAELVAAGGLRAHEIFSIQAEEFQRRATREWHAKLDDGRVVAIYPDKQHWPTYTVNGKGGNIHPKVWIQELTDKLKAVQLDTSRTVIDRGKEYTQHYDLPGGNALSQAWTRASTKVLGFSHGIHGLRHTYANLRMETFKAMGLKHEVALTLTSKELGHHSPKTTLTYLR